MRLRDAIFAKLYNHAEGRFITGRSAAGTPSEHTAIDNSTWLSSALQLEKLDAQQVNQLSSSLRYTVDNFVKTFEVDGQSFLGAHYFLSSFHDKYIEKQNAQEKALHIEATTGLILGLQDFADAWPQDANTPYFREVASQLWINLQHYIKEKGFTYSLLCIQDIFSVKEVTVSAVWYLKTHKYFTNNPQAYDEPTVLSRSMMVSGIE